MLRRTALVLVLALIGAVGVVSPAAAGDPPITLPDKPKGLKPPVELPDDLDAPSAYDEQISCNPVDMPGAVKLRNLVLDTYKQGSKGGISRGCTEGLSEHSEGRAWDWMVNVKDKDEKAAAANFISWVTKNHGEYAKRLGIMYIIYNKKIWAVYREKDGWRDSYDHTDHVHVSFSWNGARGNTSFWKGKVMPVDQGPCKRFNGTYAAIKNVANTTGCQTPATLVKRTDLKQMAYGNKSATIKSAQKKLGVDATGTFSSATWAAVKAYQAAHDIPVTGALDHPTWASLYPGHVTSSMVKGYNRLRATEYGLSKFGKTPLKTYSAGEAVVFAQTALYVPIPDRNGYFGSLTSAAVKKLQKDSGLKVTGIMGEPEWKAILASLK